MPRRPDPDQIATMRAKVAAGVSRPQIARRMGFSCYIVRKHTCDVHSEALTEQQLEAREGAERRARSYERIAIRCNAALGLSFGGQ